MFYSTELLLLRRKGKFARIWLAAILGEQMFKQSCKAAMIKQIDVAAVCVEILSTIEHRNERCYVRLSLYLSSQLMYGATKILYYQTKYLQDSVTIEITKLYDKERIGQEEYSASPFLAEVPEPPALALPFTRDEHFIIEEPYPIVIEHLMQEELNFGVLTTDELERFLLHEPGEPLEIRGLNWDEQGDVLQKSMQVPMPGINGIDTIETEKETWVASTATTREFLLRAEDGESNIPAPSTPTKRPLRSPTGTPSKRKKIHPVSPARELIPPVPTEPEPVAMPEPEIMPETQQIISAVAPPELPPEQQPVDVSEEFHETRTQRRRTIIDQRTMLDGQLIRRNLEDVTFQTREPGSCIVSLPIKLSVHECLTKPAMHMFGTNWGKTLLTFFRKHLSRPLMVPDEFDIPDFDDTTAEEIVRADEASKVPEPSIELSNLARLETIDPSKTLEKTVPLLDIGREPGDQTVEQQQSLVQLPEVTVYEERKSESPVHLSKKDLLAQMEVLWSSEPWIKFDKLVPYSYSKLEAALAFRYCLEFYMERTIILKQAEPFDTIWIKKYTD